MCRKIVLKSSFQLNINIQKIEMEKVPSLNMFSQRQMRKSSSLSKINHCDQSYRPSSSYQTQDNTNIKSKNYYDQALKILNVDSQINKNLRYIEAKHDDNQNKTSLKKVSRKPQIQMFANQTFNHPSPLPNAAPQFSRTQQTVTFNYTQPNFIVNSENIRPQQVHYIQRLPENPGHPQHFIPQNATFQNVQFNSRPENFVIVGPSQPFTGNTLDQNIKLQRVSSTQNIHFRDYSQPDKVLSSCKIEPICNNQQDQKMNKTKKFNSKGDDYTFRNQTEIQQKTASMAKITLNPFLFDATYLLEIKQSESRLPNISLSINNKEYYEQIEKKKELLQQLIEIKESNQAQGHNLLRQLDSLIQQFETKSINKHSLDQSEFKNSRKSLFQRVK